MSEPSREVEIMLALLALRLAIMELSLKVATAQWPKRDGQNGAALNSIERSEP
jgi:hypothetical protein